MILASSQRGIYISSGEVGMVVNVGKMILRPGRGVDGMLCMECGANADKGYTTDVTDLGNCLVIVRNVPCYK